MSVLYCIIHTRHQQSRSENILLTWGKNKNILFYSDHEDTSINCHKVTDRSDYWSGQIKQINIFDILINNYHNYDWYFFCDNDTFVNTTKLENYTIAADIDYIHGDIIKSWPEDKSLSYPSGGAGYLMSNKILKQMVNLHYNNTQFGDVSIGINLREKNIPLFHNSLFKGHTPQFFNIPEDHINQYMTFHYITDYNSMHNLYSLVNTNENS